MTSENQSINLSSVRCVMGKCSVCGIVDVSGVDAIRRLECEWSSHIRHFGSFEFDL